jgi:D-alanine-D-alanine ligase
MRLAVVHNAVTDQSAPDERDVLVQADAVQAALKDLRHETELLPCTLNLASVQARLQAIRPDIVFNLVESLNGQGRLIHLFPALLDAIAMPYTGADSQALYFTSNKILAKRQMVQAGLPTPPWIGPYPPDMAALAQPTLPGPALNFKDRKIRWLVKSVWEHASVGLDECELTLSESVEEVLNRLPRQAAPLGGSCFAEAYIEGREFNLSLLAGPNGPEVLAPAEIVFEDYPADKPRIVGYRAKWATDSYEYNHTPRRFDFAPPDASLLQELGKLAKQCWQVFGLAGYARVDFRVDLNGRPWILEINTNPCLSPDAGFAAAIEQSGLSFTQAVSRIAAAAWQGKEG